MKVYHDIWGHVLPPCYSSMSCEWPPPFNLLARSGMTTNKMKPLFLATDHPHSGIHLQHSALRHEAGAAVCQRTRAPQRNSGENEAPPVDAAVGALGAEGRRRGHHRQSTHTQDADAADGANKEQNLGEI
jgi:hypothetical protein